MAKETVLTCDFGQGSCRLPAVAYRLWSEGDKQAQAVDLCEQHSAALREAFEGAALVDLPTKQRARMEVTALRTTPKTAHLKK